GTAAAGELLERIDERRRHALPRHARMHIQHSDMILAAQRGKADRRILHCGNQRQVGSEPAAELLVLGQRRPRLPLRLAVVVAGQILDRRGKDRRQHRHICGQERPQRGGLAHRATSQLVPSLESLIATPMAASSSRMRSDSLKSFRARAAVRSEISALTRSASTPLALRLRPSHCAALSERKPRKRSEAAKVARSASLPRRPCSAATICAVLRSSASPSSTVSAGLPPPTSAATRYQSSSVLALSSNPLSVQSIGDR